MTQEIDVFAHVLLPDFYKEMLNIEPTLPQLFPFIQHPHLTDLTKRRAAWDGKTKQIISYVNVNPEDYLAPERAPLLCQAANKELVQTIRANRDMFAAGVAMIPMNNLEAAVQILEETKACDELVGVQLFTRALGKSIADPAFHAVFETCARLHLPIWLHPIFDGRKPDNNIIFSWEYELTQAMLQIVQAGLYQEFPDLKIIVHHAGAMVPFFGERIHYILPEEQVADFHKFYVDTAILGNSKALELTVNYFGIDHVLFGTDAPLGIAPSGAAQVIAEAIWKLPFSESDKQAIFSDNIEKMIGKRMR
ncbi:amidohydrolase family protein [Streptococcus troglodytae]|uniref:Amidohydrolase family protein n=1 Tax=Streptococcus troglodytae TaxID=1111760 RepID=A0A1L7LJW3_9STRE|nr:amidohydrolase family protein [Streptococcus troglodytae]BAQ24481.1 amidohydrolase family protein [Streptococcus troglodytae]